MEYLLLKQRIEEDCFDEDGNNSIGIASLVLASTTDSSNSKTTSIASPLKQILKLLLRREGIDINHKNMYGLTPFDIAETEHAKQLLAQFGGKTARELNMEKLLRWDREKSREEFTYCRDRARRAIVLKEQARAPGEPTLDR